MTRNEFIGLLREATAYSVEVARRFVENELPEPVRFHVVLNQSFDGNASADERVYPADDGREYVCLTEAAVGDALVRDGRCPEWIDISVEAQSAAETHVRLLCCGRYTADLRRMYYADRGTGPFGIKSPDLPVGFTPGVRFKVPTLQPCESTNGGPAVRSENPHARPGTPQR